MILHPKMDQIIPQSLKILQDEAQLGFEFPQNDIICRLIQRNVLIGGMSYEIRAIRLVLSWSKRGDISAKLVQNTSSLKVVFFSCSLISLWTACSGPSHACAVC